MTFLIGKLVGEKSARIPDQFGKIAQKIRGNEAGVGVRMGDLSRRFLGVFRVVRLGPHINNNKMGTRVGFHGPHFILVEI